MARVVRATLPMGSIRNRSSTKTQPLEPEHVIGRAPTCALYLPERYVSAQHAAIRWNGNGWELRDLGSRNGTFLDGSRLKPGETYPIHTGSVAVFGKATGEPWELVEESAPQVMAVPVGGGDPFLLDGDLLAFPSNDDPRVTIYRNAEGMWVLEKSDESIVPITNLQTFEVDGRAWRFCCTESIRTTSMAAAAGELEVRYLQLSFFVSADEARVQLRVTCGGAAFDLAARTHNYLLLTLARRRLEDAAEGVAEGTSGWVYQEDVVDDVAMAPHQLNIDVFRIRKQFAALGVVDAANIIERRPRTRQLRIGTGLLQVAALTS